MSMFDKYVRPAYDQHRVRADEQDGAVDPLAELRDDALNPKPKDPMAEALARLIKGLIESNAQMGRALQHIAFIAAEEGLEPVRRCARIKTLAEEALKRPEKCAPLDAG